MIVVPLAVLALLPFIKSPERALMCGSLVLTLYCVANGLVLAVLCGAIAVSLTEIGNEDWQETMPCAGS